MQVGGCRSFGEPKKFGRMLLFASGRLIWGELIQTIDSELIRILLSDLYTYR